MSHLVKADGIANTGEFLFSTFFRVSSDAIAAAKAAHQAWLNSDDRGDKPPLLGIIPLLVWETGGVCRQWTTHLVNCGTLPLSNRIDYATGQVVGDNSSAGGGGPDMVAQLTFDGGAASKAIDPSYIGIDCTGEYPTIGVNIVMPVSNDCELTGPYNDFYEWSGNWDVYVNAPAHDPPYDPGSGQHTHYASGSSPVIGHQRPQTFRTTAIDQDGDAHDSIVDQAFQEVYQVGMATPIVTGDEWHHLLISPNLTGVIETQGIVNDGSPNTQGQRTTGACQLFMAFDDVNKTGKELSAYWPGGSSDPNAWLTVIGYYAASNFSYQATSTDPLDGSTFSEAQDVTEYSYAPDPIPFSNVQFGIPTTPQYASRNPGLELGPTQLYTDLSRDTGSEQVRRLFIDNNGKPVDPSIAQDALGVAPKVRFYAATDWIEGTNTGNGGDFTRTGLVSKFTPNPQIG